MADAIKTAVLVLLLIALLVVVITVAYSVYDSRRTLRVGNHSPKMKKAATGPAPLKDSGLGSGTQDVGVKEVSNRTRFYVLGAIVAGVLGALYVRLWSMQVLSADEYLVLAEENYTSTFSTRAVRGRIFDRNGVELVGNRATLAVIASSDVADDRNVIHRLSNVLGIPAVAVKQRIADTSEGAQADRVVISDAPMRAVAFISEHPQIFPGISIEERAVRTYPQGTVAAHVLGYTGAVSEDELANAKTADGLSYASDDVIGKSGAELAFESVLQGVRGSKTVQVDASGNVISVIDEVESQAGNDIRLTLDINIQRAAEQAILDSFEIAKTLKFENADAGAIVVLDLEDNGVLAMASYPTFNPAEFTNGISDDLWATLTGEDSKYPLTNRAISGLYPAASTIKSFSSMASLKYGYATDTTTWTCTGIWTELGDEWAKKCWLLTGHGTIGIVTGLAVSCDVVFYNLSLNFYRNEDNPNALQEEFEAWGLGSKTNLELSGESVGRIPTAEWKAEYNADTPEAAQWNPGDTANIIIGQGDVLITPLQNAVAYSGIATGTIHRPHVLFQVLGEDDQVVIEHQPEILLEPEYDDYHISLVRAGLKKQAAANASFSDFPVVTAGKTGTAQVTGKDDYGWYIGYSPADNPKYLVACLIEQCGGGGSVCSPTARAVFNTIYGIATETISTDTSLDETR